MIKERRALGLAETEEYLDNKKEKDKEFSQFIKKFTSLSYKEAKELRKELENMDLIKLKEEHIVKIVEQLPENSVDLNKILNGGNLDEEEANKIIQVVKKFK
ncbi:hypothetical protein J4474_00525 [Candidatus Pacearchaeota archaeon]|nr:hypothetical protein [Candidatus Pacearchaeota archaeon]